MEEALGKIRPHSSSNLPHQKTPANLLIALESTFQEQRTEATPTAYFASLLTTLEGTIHKNDLTLEDGSILPAELYLLALVASFVPAPVIRSNLNTLLTLTAPLFPVLNQHAPALRSQLSLYQAVFPALDRTQLDVQGVRQAYASIIQLTIDPRPKVRRKASDVVKDLLAAPPFPLVYHPYAEKTSEWVLNTLTEINAGPFAKGKGAKHAPAPGAEIAVHVLAFLRPVVPHLPSESLPPITTILLTLPRLGNTYLSQASYSIMSDIFTASVANEASSIGSQLPSVLKVVLSSPPSKSDFTLSASWVQVLGGALVAFNTIDPKAASSELGKVWKSVWFFLESSDANVRKEAAKSLALICTCFTPALVDAALVDRQGSSAIRKIIAQVTKALDALAYARAIPEVLATVSALITNLAHKDESDGPTAAEILLSPLIVRISELRIEKDFEYKEAADATLAVAMRILGPAVLLELLPLNLEPECRENGEEPRAFLLPLLAQPHSSPLSHFVSYFVPLSEKMFDLQQKAETEGRVSEANVWKVLVSQVWAGLYGYCSRSPDLKDSLGAQFSQLLSQLLYGVPDLRTSILRALKVMVESNVELVNASAEEAQALTSALTQDQAQENLEFLRTQVESWLAVLFNVYGSVGRDSRGLIGEVINSWAAIARPEETHNAFLKVVQLLKTNLPTVQTATHGSNMRAGNDIGNMTTTSQDILLLLLPNLSAADSKALFEICLSAEVLSCRDNGVQKRGYKLLSKLVDSGKVEVDAEVIIGKLDELVDGLTPAAKKDRFSLLASLITMLPSTSMHVIPSLIPEAVLGTKEPSEKARSAAFDVIISMGKKMSAGGVVKRSKIDGMDEDEEEGAEPAPDAVANIEEFMTMLAGGLAGASPHMISATVTAISRLVFEFKDQISQNMHNEIFTTLLVFLSSANREIVKSILGFVKLAIHTLSVDLIRPHLKELVPALLNWSHDHKNHFKLKVRHIFERMLRRFNWEEVYRCAGEEDAAKVLINIKKRKERAKRKKATREEGGEEDEVNPAAPTKAATGDAFEDVLYGSESELDDSDDENEAPAAPQRQRDQRQKHTEGARLKVDNDEPMDLLSGAATRVTSAKSSDRRRKPGQDASKFKTDDETGKMIIDDSDSDEAPVNAATDVAGTAYRENITSVDGFTRGANGKIKFNKDTKKRRREEDATMDVEMADAEGVSSKPKKLKKKDEPKFGHEFKSKKAGGDVKKGGVDPYAYMSLSQASKKSGGKARIGIAGKR